MDDTILAYLAGLFDGEGCIQISGSYIPRLNRKQIVLGIKMAMQSEEAVATFASVADAKYYKHGGYGGTFECVIWQQKAVDMLEKMLPYLITKQERAKFAMFFYKVSFASRGRGAIKLTQDEVEFREIAAEMMSLFNHKDSLLFHGKAGEFGERLNVLQTKMRKLIPSQAVEGQGSTEGVTTSSVSPNNNPNQETPPSVH